MKAICMFSMLAIASLLTLSSCSKTDNGGYMCTCTYSINGTSQTQVYDLHNDTKAYAVSDCNYKQAYIQAHLNTATSCHL